ncbi:WAS/WASL-interacting protein family member 3 isoform X2 [Alosa alosa]|uniref:WAS/WASL-interacting protein family member 3 isoform X2 n=1 Tax=Alosa alosa TaxID=278164 RepID=UPI0020151B68|nr:WAS/WASL-interacting protein family member 3 isoform X2 [Alosa alosa]
MFILHHHNHKRDGIHLQVLLGAGLAVFCLSLLLGCFLCLWQMRSLPAENKESPALVTDCSTTPSADVTSSSHSPPMRVLNEEPEEEEEEAGLDYPSAFGSSTPSDDDFYMLPLATRSRTDAPKSYFPLRRLSSPTLSAPLYRPMDRPRGSLPCLPHLPRLSFLSRTRRALERRCTVAADAYPYTEHSRLTGPAPPPPPTSQAPPLLSATSRLSRPSPIMAPPPLQPPPTDPPLP